MNEYGMTKETYATKTAAKVRLEELNGATYYCESGEVDRPTYAVRKFRGKNAYGIRVTHTSVFTRPMYRTSWLLG